MTEELRYKLLKILEDDPDISQRELSSKSAVSLGKINFCIQSLKDRGLVKARNFSQSKNKKRYLYMLTPKGLEEKSKVAVNFLRQRLLEYEKLEEEIASLREEIEKAN